MITGFGGGDDDHEPEKLKAPGVVSWKSQITRTAEMGKYGHRTCSALAKEV